MPGFRQDAGIISCALFTIALAAASHAAEQNPDAIGARLGDISRQELISMQLGDYDPGVLQAATTLLSNRARLGPRHPDSLKAMSNLADLLARTNRSADAEALAREALAGFREAFGPRHPETLKATTKLADMLAREGRYPEAEALLRAALEGSREALGPRHPDTLGTMNGLGDLSIRQGRFAEAEALSREALEQGRGALEADSPLISASLNGLANAYEGLGRGATAAALREEAVRSAPSAATAVGLGATGGAQQQPGPFDGTPTSGAPPNGGERAARNILQEVDAELGKLMPGKVAFNVPESMRVGRTGRIQAVLSVHGTVSDLVARLDQEGKRESASLRVSSSMAATLSGGNAFEVNPSGPQTQVISALEPTVWRWELTPKQAGEQVLTLSFDVNLLVGGKEGKRTINSLVRTIKVDVDWPDSLTGWIGLAKKTVEDVGWLWATLFVPLAAFAARQAQRLRSPTRLARDAANRPGRERRTKKADSHTTNGGRSRAS